MINEIKIEATICGKKQPTLMTWKSGDCHTKIYVMWKGEIGGRSKSVCFAVDIPGKAAEAFIAQNMWEVGRKVFIEGHMSNWQRKVGEEWGEKNWEIFCTYLGFKGFKGTVAPKTSTAVPASAKQDKPMPPPAKPPAPKPEPPVQTQATEKEMENDAQEPDDDDLVEEAVDPGMPTTF